MRIAAAVVLIQAMLFGSPALAGPGKDPAAPVRDFYAQYVQLKPAGLPTPAQQKALSPYLSHRLLGLMDAARAYSEQVAKAHPDEKPPLVDGCLFASLFEGPKAFQVEPAAADGEGWKVRVHFTGEQGVAWDDNVLVVREDGRYVIDDVLLSGAGAFSLPGRLSANLEWRDD